MFTSFPSKLYKAPRALRGPGSFVNRERQGFLRGPAFHGRSPRHRWSALTQAQEKGQTKAPHAICMSLEQVQK